MGSDDLAAELRAARRETLVRFAELPTEALTEPFAWGGAASDLRFGLGWLAEGDEGARTRMVDILQAVDHAITVAEQAMVLAGESRGRLLGLLVGLPAPLFEQPPAPGEWSARAALGHMIATDQRYAIAVRYAVERARTSSTGPLRPPDAALPSRTDPAASAGSMDEVLQRVLATGDAVTEELGLLPDNMLSAPTNWMSWDLDVRFRLHRFAAHAREHTVQVRKTLAALGFQQTEPQMLLGDAMVTRGALEALLLSMPEDLLDIVPPSGGPSIKAIALRVLDDERRLQAR